ncbi:hypothetical protein ACFH04_07290 [Streptomyces noboritoensis]|uniref:Uncharacterized protein n=1 Tax=Streptomyces noboritoensis TaxID=67337 RepID=A0ABV6TCL7_9ACTN
MDQNRGRPLRGRLRAHLRVATARMPPLATGAGVQLLFSTSQREHFLTPGEPGPAKFDFTIEGRRKNRDPACAGQEPAPPFPARARYQSSIL